MKLSVNTPAGKVFPGTHIHIIRVASESSMFPGGRDLQAEQLDGTYGTVKTIDDSGALHGTWGGLSILPGSDSFEIVDAAPAIEPSERDLILSQIYQRLYENPFILLQEKKFDFIFVKGEPFRPDAILWTSGGDDHICIHGHFLGKDRRTVSVPINSETVDENSLTILLAAMTAGDLIPDEEPENEPEDTEAFEQFPDALVSLRNGTGVDIIVLQEGVLDKEEDPAPLIESATGEKAEEWTRVKTSDLRLRLYTVKRPETQEEKS